MHQTPVREIKDSNLHLANGRTFTRRYILLTAYGPMWMGELSRKNLYTVTDWFKEGRLQIWYFDTR